MIRYSQKIGILGGMGPEATSSLYNNIIKRCQIEKDAKYNSDFPHIIVNSVPVPDGEMWSNFDEEGLKQVLRDNCSMLENAGVDFIVVPCNSVHTYIDVMRESTKVPIMSIAEVTAHKSSQQHGLRKVALLGTHFTRRNEVYRAPLEKQGVSLILPNFEEQQIVDEIIVRIESGERSQRDKGLLLSIIRKLNERGAEGIILGCTELPLLLNQTDSDIILLDTLDILAEATYKYLEEMQKEEDNPTPLVLDQIKMFPKMISKLVKW